MWIDRIFEFMKNLDWVLIFLLLFDLLESSLLGLDLLISLNQYFFRVYFFIGEVSFDSIDCFDEDLVVIWYVFWLAGFIRHAMVILWSNENLF